MTATSVNMWKDGFHATRREAVAHLILTIGRRT